MIDHGQTGLSGWLSRKAAADLEEYARKDAAFDRLSDWEKIAINNTRGVDRVVRELQYIRWVLIAIGFSAFYLFAA